MSNNIKVLLYYLSVYNSTLYQYNFEEQYRMLNL